jgi:DNA-binding response OmpR family regulator
VTRVLIVEDDKRLAAQTARYLEARGVAVAVAEDGVAGQNLAIRERFDCIILDLNLPGRDGIDVCRSVRDRVDVPIIMVTGRDEEADEVLGLEVGADDYIVKPFSARVLLARIRAAMRRAQGRPDGRIHVGTLELDPASLSVALAGRSIEVTAHEFAILCALARRAGMVVSREQLQKATGAGDVVDRAVDVHVSHLRQKLGDDSRNPRMLKTIRGGGYLLAKDGW